MGDDGLGPQVIRRLQAFHQFDSGVSFHEAASAGLDLIRQIAGAEALIVVETVRVDGNPGTLRLHRGDEVMLTVAGPPHQPGLREILLLMQIAGEAPSHVLLVNIIAGEMDAGVATSQEVEAAIPKAESETLKELTRLGHPPRRSWAPATPALSLEGSSTN
jgi:hydrogenase maturation protease